MCRAKSYSKNGSFNVFLEPFEQHSSKELLTLSKISNSSTVVRWFPLRHEHHHYCDLLDNRLNVQKHRSRISCSHHSPLLLLSCQDEYWFSVGFIITSATILIQNQKMSWNLNRFDRLDPPKILRFASDCFFFFFSFFSRFLFFSSSSSKLRFAY